MKYHRHCFRISILLLSFTMAMLSTTGFAENDPSTSDVDSPQATDAAVPSAPAPQRGFFTRLGHAYLDDWTVDSNGSPASPEPARRGTPRPLNSPPFPAADWPIGGTVVIGAPDYGTYILMQAINENKSRIKDLRLVRHWWKRQHVEQGQIRQQRNRLRCDPELHPT